MPRLSIVILAVGTRGDVEPFVLLGKKLLEDGHRVRLATHECFRSYITSTQRNLEFYPLGGDPVRLSEYMVKTKGWILPTSGELILEAPGYISMISEILFSCWGACVGKDPKSADTETAFTTSAIISNPVSYGHV